MNSTDNALGDNARNYSTNSFVTALVINSAIAGILLLAWIVCQRWIPEVYEPRTYIPPAAKQAKVLSKNVIKMFSQIFMSDPKEILHKNGVDPYIFVRFLRMLAMAFVPIWVLSWVILMPVNSVGTTVDDMNGLDRFQFGNIARGKYSRYWAHLVLVWIFDLGFMYLIWKEMGVWLKIRIKYLSNPKHSQLPQASTVLITGIPPELMDERELARLFAPLPGGIQHIWLNRDLRDMPELWERRNKACDVLEKSQVKLLKEAAKWHTKRKGSGTPANRDAITLEDMFVPRGRRPTVRLKSGNDKRSGWGWLGIGNKVDAIEWARKEIAETTQQLRLARIQLGKDIHSKGAEGDVYAPKSSAFIQFHEQIAAHMAQQCVTYHAKFKMSSRYIEQSPSNVIWNNMSRSAYEVAVRSTAGTFIFIGIIIGWSPISAFIGAMSNITSLTKQLKWLEWLIGPGFGKMLLRGIATGILPPLLSALASMLFPILFRKMIVYEGGVSRTQVEMSVMTRFFIFLIIHSFLVITLSSGLIASIEPIINNPTSVATQLASNIPKSATFFISRLLMQFTGRMITLFQPITLIGYYGGVILGGETPRGVFNKVYRMPTVDYGTEFPLVTVYACISLAYMVVAPVINGFGAAFALLSYVVYKYLFIWVINQQPQKDTGGEFFLKAVTHLFVGMYIQQACLCALFFLARDSSLVQGIFMAILIVFTFCIQLLFRRAYWPLRTALPLSKAKKSASMVQSLDIGLDYEPETEAWTTSNLTPAPLSALSPKAEYVTEKAGASRTESRVSERKLSVLCSSDPQNTHEKSRDTDSLEESEETALSHTPPEALEPLTPRGVEKLFAMPGGPGVHSEQPEAEGGDVVAFFHPAAKLPQRIVWIPVDDLGLGAEQVKGNELAQVRSSLRDATMDLKGKVEISGPPPDTLYMEAPTRRMPAVAFI